MSHPAIPAAGPALPEISGVELSKPQRKILSSLGHQTVRLAAACERLRAKHQSMPELAPWLGRDRIPHEILIEDCGILACPLVLDGSRLTLHPLTASAAQFAAAFPVLSAVSREHSSILATSSSLNDPLWLALLRLRSLRDFWDRELRRATVDTLLGLLPDAWLLDPAPLPPGSVIPRLELASWSGLDFSGRSFIPSTSSEVDASLSAYPGAPGVLTSLPEYSPGAVRLFSFYRKTGARVDWIGATRAD